MMSYHDSDPSNPNLNLSQGELESLHGLLGRAIARFGEIRSYEGRYPVTIDGPESYVFESTLDPIIAKEIFHPDDDELLPDDTEANQLVYHQPHRMEPIEERPDEPVHEHVSVSLHWKLAGTDIQQREYYWIHKVQGTFTGTVTTDYFRDGQRISPNNLTREKHESSEGLVEFIDDLFALERPLTFDDAEKLRELGEMLGS